jgi:hypothetical protein
MFDDEVGFTLRSPDCYRKVLTPSRDTKIEFNLPDFHGTLFAWGSIGYGWK